MPLVDINLQGLYSAHPERADEVEERVHYHFQIKKMDKFGDVVAVVRYVKSTFVVILYISVNVSALVAQEDGTAKAVAAKMAAT